MILKITESEEKKLNLSLKKLNLSLKNLLLSNSPGIFQLGIHKRYPVLKNLTQLSRKNLLFPHSLGILSSYPVGQESFKILLK